MNNIKTLFFGSTSDSVIVLTKLYHLASRIYKLQISAVVTQPPHPVGRRGVLTPTPVETWARKHTIPVLSFPTNTEKPWLYENKQTVIDALQPFKADLLVSASYGQKISAETIQSAKYGGLNIHPSILPQWRGGDPVPWAILAGDHQIGVSVVTLAEKFDEGKILAQKKIPLPPDALPDPLRTELFTIGADLLAENLPSLLDHPNRSSQKLSTIHYPLSTPAPPYARRFTRDDGFEPWETITDAMTTGKDTNRLERKLRALTPWPGMWTKVECKMQNVKCKMIEGKRLKILSCHISRITSLLELDSVQLEGKKPVPFVQFQKAYW